LDFYGKDATFQDKVCQLKFYQDSSNFQIVVFQKTLPVRLFGSHNPD